MNNNQNLKAHALRTAVLRYYIADAFISLMARVHNEPVYIEDGERIELTHEKVVSNIIYHIEMPWVNEFGADAGCILAAEKLEKMLKPGFMSENIRLSVFGVTEMREVYPAIHRFGGFLCLNTPGIFFPVSQIIISGQNDPGFRPAFSNLLRHLQ